MKPFLKWPGSKQRIIEQIRAALPPGRRLIEPFVGSGAVFLAHHDKYDSFLLADTNPDLVHLYRELQTAPEAFARDAKRLFTPENNDKELYLEHRARFNALPHGSRERALLFLYLNRHGFNGLCRYNRKGGFNVAFGAYKAPYFPVQELQGFVEVSRDAVIRLQDFRATMREAGPGDVVYCDPPYVPLSETASFTAYQTAGFGLDDHRALVEEAIAASQRGADVLISNHDTDVTRGLYRCATQVMTCTARRTIGVGSREKVEELVALYRARARASDAAIPWQQEAAA